MSSITRQTVHWDGATAGMYQRSSGLPGASLLARCPRFSKPKLDSIFYVVMVESQANTLKPSMTTVL